MLHNATQTSLQDSEVDRLREENQLLHGKIRGYLTLGNILLEKKEENRKLELQNKALKEELEKYRKPNNQSPLQMETEIQKNKLSTAEKRTLNTAKVPITSFNTNDLYPSNNSQPKPVQTPVTENSTNDETQLFLIDKIPMQESLEYENKEPGKIKSTRTSESSSSFEKIDPTPSGSLSEHLGNQNHTSSQLNRQLSTSVNYGSNSSTSLNLMEFPSVVASESHQIISSPQEELNDPIKLLNGMTVKETQNESETALSIKVAEVLDLTTDGPAEKLRKFLEEQLIPEITKQEMESEKYKTCNAALMKELEREREEKVRLLQRVQQLEHQINNLTPAGSLSSQTQVIGWEYIRNNDLQKTENMTTERKEQGDLNSLEEQIRKLQHENAKWIEFFGKMNREMDKLKSENEQLKMQLSSFTAKDEKRQEEIDKILLTAKERTTEAEGRREELQNAVERQQLKMEAMEAELQETKEIVTSLHREKQNLVAELSILRRGNNQVMNEGQSAHELEMEIAVLRQQLTVFKEDFDRERNDRAQAQSVKDELKKQVENEQGKLVTMQEKLRMMERQLRSAEKNVKQTMTQNQQLLSENANLKAELRQERDLNTRTPVYQPTIQPFGYYGNQTGNSFRSQPESDPHAQPVPPYMFNSGRAQNGPVEYPPPVLTNKAQLCPEQLPGAWNCPQCTLINHPSRTVCEICGSVFTREQLQNYYRQNRNSSKHLMPRGDIQPTAEESGDLCTDSGLLPVNCH